MFDGEGLDEDRLGPSTKELLVLIRQLVASGLSREELHQMLHMAQPDIDDRIATTLRNYFEALDINKARVLCVTTDFSIDAMWGNYAGSHTGCVLGFQHIEERSTPLLAARKVTYLDECPVVGSGLDFLLYGDTSELREKTLHAVCFTKKSSWSNEQEWRVLTWRNDEGGRQYGDYQFYPEELESVTLGNRTSEATEARVRELLKERYPNTALYRMGVSNGDLMRELIS
ncbi:hypothetical protein BVK87_01740 [Achromobacter denitrificans]|nr:hypothetical protein BVK87_01740 [Achromobacter denitrificans]